MDTRGRGAYPGEILRLERVGRNKESGYFDCGLASMKENKNDWYSTG